MNRGAPLRLGGSGLRLKKRLEVVDFDTSDQVQNGNVGKMSVPKLLRL
jgi:hypothetical protein